jgi:hypothetical protein
MKALTFLSPANSGSPVPWGSVQVPLRLYWGSIEALLRLYWGSIEALLRLHSGSIEALLALTLLYSQVSTLLLALTFLYSPLPSALTFLYYSPLLLALTFLYSPCSIRRCHLCAWGTCASWCCIFALLVLFVPSWNRASLSPCSIELYQGLLSTLIGLNAD